MVERREERPGVAGDNGIDDERTGDDLVVDTGRDPPRRPGRDAEDREEHEDEDEAEPEIGQRIGDERADPREVIPEASRMPRGEEPQHDRDAEREQEPEPDELQGARQAFRNLLDDGSVGLD